MAVKALPRYPTNRPINTDRRVTAVYFDGTEARMASVVVSAGIDEITGVNINAQTVFDEDASTVDVNNWLVAVQYQFLPLYVEAQVQAWGAISAGLGLGVSNSAALTVFAANSDCLAQWNTYIGALEDDKGSALTNIETHNAIFNFTTLGRITAKSDG